MCEVGNWIIAVLSLASAVLAADAPREYAITLGRLGYRDGLLFEAVRETQSVSFPLPRDTRLLNGRLDLHLKWSPLLRSPSSLRITVADGGPTHVVPLAFGANEAVEVSVPIHAGVLQRRQLQVQLTATAITGHDVCTDDHLRSGLLQILPESALHATPAEAPSTPAAVIDRMPEEVRLAVSPGPLPRDAWTSAWQLTALLQSRGHDVRIVQKPLPADLDVTSFHASNLAPLWPPQAGVNEFDGKPLLVNLTALHAGSTIREVASRGDWLLRPTANVLPPHYRITQAAIRISHSVPQNEQPPQVMVYAGETLIRTFQLAQTGEPQEYRFSVPPSEYLRVSVQRTNISGACLAAAPPSPFQLLPGTEVTATVDKTPFQLLSEAGPALRGNARLVLDSEVLRNAEQLPALTRLISALGLDPVQAEVWVAGSTGSIATDRPFVAVGTNAPTGVTAPLRLDRGELRLTDALGRTLLQAPPMPSLTLLQVVRSGGAPGIWIRPTPAGTFSSADRVELGSGNVALLDNSGLLRGFDTRQVEVVAVRYPGLANWERWLRERMVWLLGVAWFALTIVFVSLYRRFSRHKELV